MSHTRDRLSSLCAQWRDEVRKRRQITSIDPVADTLAHCADELDSELRDVSEVNTRTYASMNHKSVQTVRRWCKAQKIRARRVGNDWLILRTETPPDDHARRKGAA